MKLSKFIDKTNMDIPLGLSKQPTQRRKIANKKDRDKIPYWYGIKPIKFIWCGEWSDPWICFNRMVVPAPIVEDTMIERYNEECEENGTEYTDEKFAKYMKANKYYIVELIELTHSSESN